MQPLYTPDDPEADPSSGKLTYLQTINAYQAWSHEQGDNNVYVGILDSGVDMDHPDLAGNIKVNHNDPINGIDDDGDGLIDNYRGYDFSNDDNQPEADKSSHGTSVTGVGFSVTDNNLGLAGVGFNTKYIPYKIFTSQSNFFYRGYEAMVFAAENGCKVLNLSWGAPNARSKYVEDIINYIVLELDVVVVAAAGNTHGEYDFYPASYTNVLSVGSTNYKDEKADFASYSPFIDIMAPGKSIYVTGNNDFKYYSQGTSLSTAMVSATAALIRARYPDLTALQVMERIRVTADDIYQIETNKPYTGKLGHGRLNVGKALLDYTTPSLRMIKMIYHSKSGKHAFYGDSLMIETTISNLLSTSSNAKAILRSNSPYVTIIDSIFNIGSLSTNKWKVNSDNPFKIYIDPSTPPKQQLRFTLHFSDNDYTASQTFDIFTEPDFFEIEGKNLKMTVGSSGSLAFTSDSLKNGIGLIYNDSIISRSLGLFYFHSSDSADNSFLSFKQPIHSKDFVADRFLKKIERSQTDYDEITSRFKKPSDNIRIEQHLFADNIDTDADFIILEYNIFNEGPEPVNDFYLSLLSDYSIIEDTSNRLFTNEENKLTYAVDSNNKIFAGISLISKDQFISRGIDLADLNGNISDVNSTFTKIDKADYITNLAKNAAGLNGNGNNIAAFTGTKISKINPGELKKIVFVLTAGNSLNNLNNNLLAATQAYQEILQNPQTEYYQTICKGEDVEITPGIGSFNFYSDPSGINKIAEGTSLLIEALQTDTTIYYNSYDSIGMGIIKTASIGIDIPRDTFSISENPLYLSESSDSTAIFKAYPDKAKSYLWDFGNGLTSSNQKEVVKYNQKGIYPISLVIESPYGCMNEFSSNLEVITRPYKADIGTTYYNICKNEDLQIKIDTEETLYFFTNPEMNELITSGNELIVANVNQDTSIFISRRENNIYSEPVEIIINVGEANADFYFSHDPSPFSGLSIILKAKEKSHLSYDWNINGELLSESIDVRYVLQNSENHYFELKVVDSTGCTGILQKNLIPKELDVTIKDTIAICHDAQEIEIIPEDQGVYLFYADNELNNLIQKGRSYIHNINSEIDSVFIVNFTEFSINTPKKVILQKSQDKKPVIIADTQTINLNIEKTVNLRCDNNNFINYRWFLPNEAISTGSQTEYSFRDTGQFLFTLVATDSAGCDHYSDITVEVINEPLLGIIDTISSSVKVYPNPAYDKLNIDSESTISEWKIVEASGKILTKGYGNQINISSLAAGTYYLILIDSNQNKKALPFIKK
nr:S8 family serine peptidase [Mangrovivirga halotolerans]